jgi:glycosyltransferase involved in cell wall biosynthesis
MKLSIVLAYHNEGEPFLMEGINQIRNTIDIPREDYELIVVDDGSVIPLRELTGMTIIRHKTNRGVGAAFDSGVAVAKSDNIFLAASDIRYIKNNWASLMLKEIEDHPKAITCSSCINLNSEKPENMDLEKRRKISVINGSTIIFFHDKLSNPRMTPTFRGIIECQWLPYLKDRNIDSFPIPCILGAFYGVKKEWYQYIDGFHLHHGWGTLEPLIGLKSWLFGGENRTAPRVETGHLFKKVGTHGTSQDILMHNKMLVATLLFDDYQRLIDFLGSNPIVERARAMYRANLPAILEKKAEYKNKTVYSIEDYVNRWKIDYRK